MSSVSLHARALILFLMTHFFGPHFSGQASSPPMSPPLPQRPVPQRPPPAAADDIHEWDCQTCTYKHVGPEAGFLACSVCGSPRP